MPPKKNTKKSGEISDSSAKTTVETVSPVANAIGSDNADEPIDLGKSKTVRRFGIKKVKEEPGQAAAVVPAATDSKTGIIEQQSDTLVRTTSITPIVQTEFGFLTTDIKSKSDFQTTLGNLAAADFRHDFHINVMTQGLDSQFNKGLPASITRVYTEDDVLNAVVKLDILGVEDFKDFLATLTDEKPKSEITICVPSGNNANTIANYEVIRYAPENYTSQPNFGKDFCEKTDLAPEGGEAYLIVDFNQHGFFAKMKEGDNANRTIHYLVTPEVVNDPAPKPSIHDVDVFGNPKVGKTNTGVTFKSYVQTDAAITIYTDYKANDINFSNNFFTKYNFSINPITQIFQKGTKSTLNTTVNITYNRKDGLPFTAEINDSKKQNSKNSLKGFIDDVIPQIRKTNPKDEDIFDFNSKLQQKRSGDWLQGLCCLDIKQKKFSRILPNPERDVALSFEGPVYLLTHDRIALAYALCNGVNVIYLGNDKTTYVFKNSSDKTIISEPLENRLYNKIGSFILDSKINTKKVNIYNQARNKILELCNTDLTTKIDDAKQASSLQGITGEGYSFISNFKEKFNKTIIKKYQALFQSAVELQFILNNLIDISIQWEIINDFKQKNVSVVTKKDKSYDVFKSLDDLKTENSNILDILQRVSTAIDIINTALNKLDTSQFTELGGLPKDLVTNIKNNLVKLVKKTDVHKTAASVLTINSSDETISTFQERLLNFAEQRETDEQIIPPKVCDQFIFLSSIQTLNPDIYLTKIVECIEEFKKIVLQYGTVLQEQATKRSGVKPDEKSIYFRSANLIYESLLLLKVKKVEEQTTFQRIVTVITNMFSAPPVNIEKLEFTECTSGPTLQPTPEPTVESISTPTAAPSAIPSATSSLDMPCDTPTTKIKVINESTDVVLVNTSNKQRRINISRIGKQSDKQLLPQTEMVGGGLSLLNRSDIRSNVKIGIVYDSTSDQITFQLLSNVNDTKPYYADIKKYYKILIKKTIKEADAEAKSEDTQLITPDEEDKEYDISDFDTVVSDFLKIPEPRSDPSRDPLDDPVYRTQQFVKSIMEEQEIPIQKPPVITMQNFLMCLLFLLVVGGGVGLASIYGQSLLRGGGITDLPISFIPRDDISYKELLKDTNFSAHPLLSIYMILISFYNQLDSGYNDDPFYDTYITYIKILDKFTDVISNEYLNESSDISKASIGYFIGYALRTMFFTANKSNKLFAALCKQLNLTEDEYRMFSLKSSMFGSSMFGDIIVEPDDFEEVTGLLLIESAAFSDFINNKVKFKELLQTPVTPEEIPKNIDEYSDKLGEQIESVLNKIVEKINIDRIGDLSKIDLPLINVSLPEVVSDSVSDEDVEKPELENPELEDEDAVAKGIAKPTLVEKPVYKSVKDEEDSDLMKPKDKSIEQYLSRLKLSTPSSRTSSLRNMLYAPTPGRNISTPMAAGKTRKNKNKKKRYTRGKNKNYKNKTIKKNKNNRHKKSIKH